MRLLTLILDPQEGETVNDSTWGSGGMLVEMANVVREHGGDARTLNLSGQEVSLTTAAIARMNLFLDLTSSDLAPILGHTIAGITEAIYIHAFNREAREARVRKAMMIAMGDCVAT